MQLREEQQTAQNPPDSLFHEDELLLPGSVSSRIFLNQQSYVLLSIYRLLELPFVSVAYIFPGRENEYPHKFREWGVSGRRLTKAIVDEIVAAMGRRSETRLSTSKITLKRGQREENLDIKRVKRHLGDGSSSARPEMMPTGWYVMFVTLLSFWALITSRLSSWPLPYAAFVSALPRGSDAAYGRVILSRRSPECSPSPTSSCQNG